MIIFVQPHIRVSHHNFFREMRSKNSIYIFVVNFDFDVKKAARRLTEGKRTIKNHGISINKLAN